MWRTSCFFLSSRCAPALPSPQELASSPREQVGLQARRSTVSTPAVRKAHARKMSGKLFSSSFCLVQPLSSSPLVHAQLLQKQRSPWQRPSARREGSKGTAHTPARRSNSAVPPSLILLVRSNFYSLLPKRSCLLHVLEIDKYCRIRAAN